MVGRDPGDLFPAWSPTPERRRSSRSQDFAAGDGARRRSRAASRRGPRHRRPGRPGPGGSPARPLRRHRRQRRASAHVQRRRRACPASVPRANALGLAYVPADRKREGLHLIHSIACNLMLPRFARARGAELRDGARGARRSPSGLANQLHHPAATSTRQVAGAVRRQPAEGRAGQVDAARSAGPPPQRSDPRRRRRDQARDLRAAPPLRGGGQGGRPARAPTRPSWSISAIASSSCARAGSSPCSSARRSSEEAIVAAAMGADTARAAA